MAPPLPLLASSNDQEVRRAAAATAADTFAAISAGGITCFPSVATLLRHHLVLDVDRGRTGVLVFADRPNHVDGIAVTGISARDHRDRDRCASPARVVNDV